MPVRVPPGTGDPGPGAWGSGWSRGSTGPALTPRGGLAGEKRRCPRRRLAAEVGGQAWGEAGTAGASSASGADLPPHLPAPDGERRHGEGPGRDVLPPAVDAQSRRAAGDGPAPAREAAAGGGLPGLPGEGPPRPGSGRGGACTRRLSGTQAGLDSDLSLCPWPVVSLVFVLSVESLLKSLLPAAAAGLTPRVFPDVVCGGRETGGFLAVGPAQASVVSRGASLEA